jgi:hypothetical protein
MKKIILRILLILFSNLSHFDNNPVKYYTAIQMKTFIIAVMLLLSALFLTAEKILTFSELVNPHKIIVAGDEIIIEEFPKIYVYSVKDFKLKHSFGKEGEGPGEFLKRSGYVRLNITVTKDLIFVESNGRLTFFSRKGEYIRQLNSAASGYLFKLLANGKLVANKDVAAANTRHKTLNLFNAENLKLEKQFCQVKHGTQPGKAIILFDKVLRSYVDDKYIYVVSDFDFIIDVFDLEGNPVLKIRKKDYKPLKISEEDKEETHAYLKIALPSYPSIKDRLKFPENFLAIKNIVFDDNLLYVTTYFRKDDGLECFVFNQKGKFLKKIFLPLAKENIFREYPYDIYKGKIYQLVENDSEEGWDLHIRKIK